MESLPKYKAEIGKTIRSKRAESGMSLRSFGLMAGVHYNQLLKIEQGKANPSLETLCKIADGLDVEVSDLLTSRKG